MAINYNPRITTNGLVLALDAGNIKSYSGFGTTWADLSRNGNNGTLINGVGYNPASLGSFSFDGIDDYVNCGTNSILNGSNNGISIDLLCKINTASAAYTGIITKLNENTYEGWAIQYVSESADTVTCRWFGGGNNSNSLQFNINKNEITRICCTTDSSGLMKVFLNGNLNTQYQGTTFNLNSTQPLTIGKLNYSNNYLNADIYDVKVYNKELNSQEAQQNFNVNRSGFDYFYYPSIPQVTQPFLEYVTTSVSSFTLRASGTVNYTVDWGDGTVENLTTTAPTHTYSSAGSYTIKITPAEGSTYRPYFNNALSDTSIASVSGTGGSKLGISLYGAWYGANNMTSFSGDIDTSNVVYFNFAWYSCNKLTSFPLINTSKCSDFTQTWRSCSSLTSFPLINTSSGTNFTYAWAFCNKLSAFPLIDTSSGTTFEFTWGACSSLTSFPLINTSSGTNFTYAWINCSSLTSFPLINTSSGTNFLSAWRDCSSLTSFPLINTSSGTNFSVTWMGCSSLTSFPLINTSSATNLSSTWANCSSLTSFPLINTSSATNLSSTWANCTSLTSFPVLNFSSGTNFVGAWTGCALTAQSIENILVALDTAGKSNLTTSISGGTNAGYSTWTAAAQTALANLQAKGWSITYNA